VRLYQGDYNQETAYSDSPVEVALQWQSMGAPRLHIVDLDGAARGELSNLDIVRQIVDAMLVPVQVGGGIRQLGDIAELLKAGVERVILGTAAIEDKKLLEEACNTYRESVIVSLDAREGYVSTHGWLKETDIRAVDLARSLVKTGVRRFIYTDISRDGTLSEPNFTAIYELVAAVRAPVIAAGGISSISHLKMLKQLGVEGAIIGKALYDKQINLKEAIATIS
jgi:phosphoribosylformimino-5-aminoimidazole carboxamide ribotide isomerase